MAGMMFVCMVLCPFACAWYLGGQLLSWKVWLIGGMIFGILGFFALLYVSPMNACDKVRRVQGKLAGGGSDGWLPLVGWSLGGWVGLQSGGLVVAWLYGLVGWLVVLSACWLAAIVLVGFGDVFVRSAFASAATIAATLSIVDRAFHGGLVASSAVAGGELYAPVLDIRELDPRCESRTEDPQTRPRAISV